MSLHHLLWIPKKKKGENLTSIKEIGTKKKPN